MHFFLFHAEFFLFPLVFLKVMGHNPYRQHVTARDGHITDKAAQVLGVIPPGSGGRGGVSSSGSRVGGGYRRGSTGRGSRGGGPRSMVEEEVSLGLLVFFFVWRVPFLWVRCCGRSRFLLSAVGCRVTSVPCCYRRCLRCCSCLGGAWEWYVLAWYRLDLQHPGVGLVCLIFPVVLIFDAYR